MCVASLNEIRESIFELLRTHVKTYGSGGSGGGTNMKSIYPRLSSGDINIIEDIQVLKEELRTIRETNLMGNMLRARAQKYIDFEKPTKYFCNLEKQNYTSKVVNKVRTSNGMITNQQTILKELENFDKTLLQSKHKDNQNQSKSHFWSKKILNP